jgi:hypothetical protein
MERAFPFAVVRQLLEPGAGGRTAKRGKLFTGPASRVERLLSGGEDKPVRDGGGLFAVRPSWTRCVLSRGAPRVCGSWDGKKSTPTR